MLLKGKHILLGVTGSIAAYKAAALVRLLVKEGASVKVIMTEMAKAFVSPLTFATLSKNPIAVDFYNPENGDWHSHVSMGCWADLYIIAPASANTISKMAYGIADNLLLTTYLSAKCKVAVAPAMDLDMFKHEATRQSLEILKKRGVFIIEPASGELASGLEGKGRMEEPENILMYIHHILSSGGSLSGKKVVITAGPTCEEIDPVRYITNHSTGKMAYALAIEAASRGAAVTLISGPVALKMNHPSINIIDVVTAAQMFSAVEDELDGAEIVVLCAAVSDFRPDVKASQKIKRKEGFALNLLPTRDIAEWVGKHRPDGCKVVGFALETENEIENARSKMARKGLDMIVLNSMNDKGAGFGSDTNKIRIISGGENMVEFPLKSKREVSTDIFDAIERLGYSKDLP